MNIVFIDVENNTVPAGLQIAGDLGYHHAKLGEV